MSARGCAGAVHRSSTTERLVFRTRGNYTEIDGSAQFVEVDTGTDTAWIAAGAGGLVAVDVSDATAPEVVGVYDSPGTALQVSVSGDHAYLADWNDVRVVDIADRTAPRAVATERIDTGGPFPRVLGVAALDNDVFPGEWTGLYSYRFHPDRAAPDLWIDSRSVDFGTVTPGDARARAVIVQNQGTARLALWAIETTGDTAFSVEPSQLVLDPGDFGVIEVAFRPGDTETAGGDLELWSDDPDEGLRSLSLVGNRPGASVGDPAPDVAVQLLEGGQWFLADQRGKVVMLSYFATF